MKAADKHGMGAHLALKFCRVLLAIVAVVGSAQLSRAGSQEPEGCARIYTRGLDLSRQEITRCRLLAPPNYGAAFGCLLNGRPYVLKFELEKARPLTRVIADKVRRAGYGVKFYGDVQQKPDELIRRMDLAGRRFVSLLDEEINLSHSWAVGVWEFLRGFEKGKNHETPFPVKWPEVRNQLRDFVEFCTREGIRIGPDLQYFIDKKSRVRVFDYDTYEYPGSPEKVAQDNARTLKEVLDALP